MNRAVICFGSNIEPRRNVALALEMLGESFGVFERSRTRRTRPVGRGDQADFLNGAVLIETPLGRDAVLRELHAIEGRLGRSRDAADPDGPRTIDLDLVVWNAQVVHDDYRSRDFVRGPVDELCGDELRDGC